MKLSDLFLIMLATAAVLLFVFLPSLINIYMW